MGSSNLLPLTLGLIIFSFLISSVLVVPFINLLYKLRLTRAKEAPKKGKVNLFDKLHDVKAGTPVGGGNLVIFIVVVLFAILFPVARRLGIYIQSSYSLGNELFVMFFTFISFGLLGLLDDLVKIFGKKTSGPMGLWVGLRRWQKFSLQCVLGIIIGYLLYNTLGIHIVHVPLLNITYDLGMWYIPFSAFVVISFSNAFNITDGLDGLIIPSEDQIASVLDRLLSSESLRTSVGQKATIRARDFQWSTIAPQWLSLIANIRFPLS